MAVCIDSKNIPANAWISSINECANLLNLAYASGSGEIWLYDNDLAAFKDGVAFKELYLDRIGGYLARRVTCVKIVVTERLFEEFRQPDENSPLFKNLCKLSPDRLRTFYVGCLKSKNGGQSNKWKTSDGYEPKLIRSPKGKGSAGDHPWIFYVAKDYQLSADSITILRPRTDPFQALPDDEKCFAVAWDGKDKHGSALTSRLSEDDLRQLFVGGIRDHFCSVEPRVHPTNGKLVGFDLRSPRSRQEVIQLSKGLPDRGNEAPIVRPVDVGIVTALDEEFQAVFKRFDLKHDEDYQGRAFGWIGDGDDRLSVVAVQSMNTGSIEAAITTERLLNEWKPRCVLLLGRCGAVPNEKADVGQAPEHKQNPSDDLVEGDVIVAEAINAYEYQAIASKDSTSAAPPVSDGEARPVRDGKLSTDAKSNDDVELDQHADPEKDYVRRSGARSDFELSHHLRLLARRLIQRRWRHLRKSPRGGERKPKARMGHYACGHKLIRAGKPWFEYIRVATADRYVIATEMEGEGVSRAARYSDVRPQFLMIKSISDFANMGKSDSEAEFASETAAQFAYDMLKLPGVKEKLR